MLVSAIIPTKNEREAISQVIEATKQALDGYSYEIIVVDKSSDETPDLAAKARARVVRQIHRGGGGRWPVGGVLSCSGRDCREDRRGRKL